MRAVIQRVKEARVRVLGECIGEIARGFVVLLGVEQEDTQEDLDYLAKKISGLRIFSDDEDKMNLNLAAVDGEILLISQFTLLGNTRKGNRPSFVRSGDPDKAETLYEEMKKALEQLGHRVETGEFGASMEVELINEGPVTILIDSRKEF
ncbi:MAG: D-tyrosyl-tRNA(Tyr) deacylase [Tissierellia bacterium]|jgi:D-tyrosyl-tRNA(Tyr) deacylase|nr:D-tyrosyl-tRNA(Tyr) deacylase [Tissierellia bacterium]